MAKIVSLASGMIQTLEIKNYKSIKHLQMNCKRVNVFIGEPNAGKSNIVEALGILSPGFTENFSELTRVKNASELFFDFQTNEPIILSSGQFNYSISYTKSNNAFRLEISEIHNSDDRANDKKNIEEYWNNFQMDASNYRAEIKSKFRYYKFKNIEFNDDIRGYLHPPYGDNIPELLLTNKELRNSVLQIFRDKGFKLNLKPRENEIHISKDTDEDLYISYAFDAASETLRRIFFLNLAIKSNKDSILLFDELEANTFPFYTKYFAETIALDETNQYFFTTHNPYLLMSLVEKTKVEDLNICIARMENYETKVYPLRPEQFSEALDLGPDIFYNLDSFID
ncbi:MAG TPA: AAA family ATPase [Bacteroidia bacterium]|nr:AAA family ATPase [Bacteroidia bacterium]